MLEALQDIEIASKLVGFDSDSDESLDDKYMKLRCNITPLPHDSEDYKLVERYLLNTHAPTHKVWSYVSSAQIAPHTVHFCLCYMAVFILFIWGSSAKPHVMFFLKDWSLELEEVFSLDRDGELNKYSRYKNNLHNKMLLWHGKQ
jgi:poly [ADP-ribose] polymerase